jgi:hypothetical protein
MASWHSREKGNGGDMLIAFMVGVVAMVMLWLMVAASDAEAASMNSATGVHKVYLPIVETEPEFSSIGPVGGGG